MHENTSSTHNNGLAIDFIIKKHGSSVSKSSTQILDSFVYFFEALKRKGLVDFYQDEYRFPSSNATGGHFHVTYNNNIQDGDTYNSQEWIDTLQDHISIEEQDINQGEFGIAVGGGSLDIRSMNIPTDGSILTSN